MPIWLIQNGEIVGTSNEMMTEAELPLGITIQVTEEERDREDVFFDGEKVINKPLKSSPDEIWDIKKKKFVKPEITAAIPVTISKNWDGFYDFATSSSLWSTFLSAAEQSLPANARFSNLSVVLVSKNEAKLETALKSMIAIVVPQPAKKTLTDFVKSALDYGIKIAL